MLIMSHCDKDRTYNQFTMHITNMYHGKQVLVCGKLCLSGFSRAQKPNLEGWSTLGLTATCGLNSPCISRQGRTHGHTGTGELLGAVGGPTLGVICILQHDVMISGGWYDI